MTRISANNRVFHSRLFASFGDNALSFSGARPTRNWLRPKAAQALENVGTRRCVERRYVPEEFSNPGDSVISADAYGSCDRSIAYSIPVARVNLFQFMRCDDDRGLKWRVPMDGPTNPSSPMNGYRSFFHEVFEANLSLHFGLLYFW